MGLTNLKLKIIVINPHGQNNLFIPLASITFHVAKENLQMKLDMNGVLTLTNFGLNKTKQFFGLQNLKLQERAFKHHERL